MSAACVRSFKIARSVGAATYGAPAEFFAVSEMKGMKPLSRTGLSVIALWTFQQSAPIESRLEGSQRHCWSYNDNRMRRGSGLFFKIVQIVGSIQVAMASVAVRASEA